MQNLKMSSDDGITHGCAFSMPGYAIELLPLMQSTADIPNGKQSSCTDD